MPHHQDLYQLVSTVISKYLCIIFLLNLFVFMEEMFLVNVTQETALKMRLAQTNTMEEFVVFQALVVIINQQTTTVEIPRLQK